MKIAIMQPYFFPYFGYFQLINAVDTFVIYDDVNYIKKGWINRNTILVNGQSFLFSIALKEMSQNKLINQIEIDNYSNWNKNLVKTISLSYRQAPYFKTIFPLLEDIILHDEKNLAKFITYSLKKVCHYLKIETTITISSSINKDITLKGTDKIIELCKKLGATNYVNASGGKELYDKEVFAKQQIELHFIESKKIEYKQYANSFIPWLSIIDVMMFNSVDEIKDLLLQQELV